jgi:hypothetical protein
VLREIFERRAETVTRREEVFLANLNSRSNRRSFTHNLCAHNICHCTVQRMDINTLCKLEWLIFF